MRPVAPRVGLPELTIAEEQEEYMPLTVALFTDEAGRRGVLSRWRPTPEERKAVADGADLYVMQLTFGGRMQPLLLSAGRPPWAPAEEPPGRPVEG